MIKRLKKYGNNLVIVFTKEEEITYGLQVNDPIGIEDMLIDEVALSRLNKVIRGKKNPVKQGASSNSKNQKTKGFGRSY